MFRSYNSEFQYILIELSISSPVRWGYKDYFMKVARHGIYARVVDISAKERVSVANEWVFWYKNNEGVNTVKSTFHAVICLFHTQWDFHRQPDFQPSLGTTNVKLWFYSVRVQTLCKHFANTLQTECKPSVNALRTECLPRHQSTLQLRSICCPSVVVVFFCRSFASSFQAFPYLVKLFVDDNAHGLFSRRFCSSLFVQLFLDVRFNGLI